MNNFLSFVKFPEISIKFQNEDTRLNFYRNIKLIIPVDILIQIRFGSETRREQTVTQSNGIDKTKNIRNTWNDFIKMLSLKNMVKN